MNSTIRSMRTAKVSSVTEAAAQHPKRDAERHEEQTGDAELQTGHAITSPQSRQYV
jgi:hypothetical protein